MLHFKLPSRREGSLNSFDWLLLAWLAGQTNKGIRQQGLDI